MKPSHPISRSTSHRERPRRHLNAFRGVRAISEFDWPFTPTLTSFQRLLVRTSIPCYRDFILDKCRSLGFASTADDSPPSSDSLSLRLGASLPLTWPTTVTRRFIMQKARRHSTNELRPLVGIRFQELFHSPVRGAFHLSFTVLVHYRVRGAFHLSFTVLVHYRSLTSI